MKVLSIIVYGNTCFQRFFQMDADKAEGGYTTSLEKMVNLLQQ